MLAKSEDSALNKKRICALTCVITMVGLIVTTMVVVSLNFRDDVRDLETRNSDGTTGTAFVAFRAGISGFNEDIVNEFVRGLIEQDWRIEITTTSSETPTNVTGYDFIVLACPVNGGAPHQFMLDYLARVDFTGKPVVLILTSGGENSTAAMDIYRQATIDANGIVHTELPFWLLDGSALSEAYTAGSEFSL